EPIWLRGSNNSSAEICACQGAEGVGILFPALCAVSSVVEHYLDTVGVRGSNPLSRTISFNMLRRFTRKDLVIYGPRPQYPYEARVKRPTGHGIVWLYVDPGTGYVTSARMLPSTGHKILDDAALDAFRQSRFKPNAVVKVRMPITFTLGRVR